MWNRGLYFWLVPTLAFTLMQAIQGTFGRSCVDYKGNIIQSGSHFIPYSSQPCLECICIEGNGRMCSSPVFCPGKVDCSHPRWNTTICCRSECLGLKSFFLNPDFRVGTLDDRSSPDLIPTNGAVLSPRLGSGPSSDDLTIDDSNATVLAPPSPPRTTNTLPSPYYPVLIGLISCAPVALCIVCVNAARKYFALRNQFPASGILPRRRPRGARSVTSRAPASPTYADPPPNYTDISEGGQFSEKLPRYEDVIEHDRIDQEKIFATMSSAQFYPPERIYLNHGFATDAEECTSSKASSELPNSDNTSQVSTRGS